ncbi:uncharacterized protein LOC132285602 isoform X2 [Cornus florida]|uniref:uncharacterized protein LOC132285602 isoform X2 n=1 Tax=Cornus florida TaxID=4283 RepID=UPI00289A90D8|nr:uncharacterized protein LOC132285602 isoform X2 [Cornus florida]
MDESEKIHNLEDTHKVELESEGRIIVVEGDVADENSETVKETHDDNYDESTEPVVVDAEEPKEEEKRVLHSTEPPVESLSEKCSTKVPTEDVVESESKEIEVNEAASPVASNGVLAPLDMDVVSKGIEPPLDESETNGVPSDIVKNLVPKGVESSTDENNECEASNGVSDSIPEEVFEETELPDSDGNASSRELPVAVENAANILQPADDIPGVHADNGGENCNASEGHDKNTNKQPYISLIPSPVQRTSWRGCCGLFEVLRRSNC